MAITAAKTHRVLAGSTTAGSESVHAILDAVRRNQPISRFDLAKHIGTSSATVTRAVNDLLDRRLLEETETEEVRAGSGRRPRVLKLNTSHLLILTVLLNPTATEIALLDLAGRRIDAAKFETKAKDGPEPFVERLGRQVERVIRKNLLTLDRLLGLGIGLPGDFVPSTGEIEVWVALGWPPVALPQMIERRLGIPTVAGNAVEMATLAEHYFGVTKTVNDYWYLFLGQGVSAARVQHGMLSRGVGGQAGNIGHVPFIAGDALCGCGRRGCLEAAISETAILAEMEKIDGLAGQSVKRLFELAASNDPAALQLAELVARRLAMGVVILLSVTDPGMVVIAGPVIEDGGQWLLERVRAHVREMVVHDSQRDGRVVTGSLADKTAVMGAAALVYGDLFAPPRCCHMPKPLIPATSRAPPVDQKGRAPRCI